MNGDWTSPRVPILISLKTTKVTYCFLLPYRNFRRRSSIGILSFSMVVSARLGIYQETLVKEFGKHPQESLYYSDTLREPPGTSSALHSRATSSTIPRCLDGSNASNLATRPSKIKAQYFSSHNLAWIQLFMCLHLIEAKRSKENFE
ncbi:unnamed protein product, partial [Darwinula stevensoni]